MESNPTQNIRGAYLLGGGEDLLPGSSKDSRTLLNKFTRLLVSPRHQHLINPFPFRSPLVSTSIDKERS